MARTESIESIPDAGRTIEGLRDTGYNFETAVADLIDNSISAGASNIDILVQQNRFGHVRLSIADDGCGMDKDGLILAMQYGAPKRPDPASLGKFGLGLKTASTAFCRRLSLISRPSENAPPFAAIWDLDYVVKERKWLLQMSEEPDEEALQHLDELAPGKSGTVVLWSKVDRLLKDYQNPAGGHARNALKKRRDNLKEHIAMTYQRFLDASDKRARNIKISVNGQAVQPWDPFQTSFSELVADENFQVKVGNVDTEFRVRAYVLPRREDFTSDELMKAAKISPDRQGLYIYREERLIHAADWLGMYQKEQHGALLRVEFSFDHKLDDAFHLDIKKSQIILNDDLWDVLKDQFLPAPRRIANQKYREGYKKKVSGKAKDAHDPSNNSIRNKEGEIGGPEVSVSDPNTGEVIVNNEYGTSRIKLNISKAMKPGEVFIQPVDGINEGLLYEPTIIERHKAVRINTQHPYYHKVYVPNLNRSVTVQGMDSLLWALCVAELGVTSDETNRALESMRYEVTRILRKLVEDLPEPDIDEESDAA